MNTLGGLLAAALCLGSPALLRRRLCERARGARLTRREWAVLFLGLGLLLDAVGEGLWTYYETVLHEPPFPSWADAGYLSFYPFVLLGILLLPARPLPRVTRTRIALDSVMLLAAAVTFSWYFVLGPTLLQGGESLLARVVGTAYPVGDLVLVACVLLLQAHTRDRSLRPAIILLSTGLGCIVIADSIFDYQNLLGAYATGSLIDPIWPLGYFLLGLGCRAARRAPASGPWSEAGWERDGAPARPLWRALAPYAVVPAVGALLVYARLVSGDETLEPGVYLGSSVLLALVFARQLLTILENQRLYARLARRERQLQTVVSSAPVVLFTLDRDGICTLAEGAALESLQAHPADLMGHSIFDFFPPVSNGYALLRRALAGDPCAGRVAIAGRVFELQAQPVLADRSVAGAIGVAVDVTKNVRAEEALRHQAQYDTLTGLPNRALLNEELARALAACSAHHPLALLLLDLDRFKEVNDTLGHHYGDLLLRQIGPRLRGALRAADTIGRLGGDEFAVLLPGTDVTGAVEVARTLLGVLEMPLCIEGHLLEVGASIGIAVATEPHAEAATLVRHADVAMYAAKRAHSGYSCYDVAVDQHSLERLALVGDLRRALMDDQLLLHYQPKVSLASGEACGVEALLRWRHPVHGFIPPDTFIPLTEHTGLIKPLTVWVLRTALRQVQAWHRGGLRLGVAVNLSARLLHDDDLPATIGGLLQDHGVAPEWLTLEITESALMAEPERAVLVVHRLGQLGVQIAIDDFGTGYSSLGYLKQLCVDEIKIDKTFVRGLGTASEPTDEAIVRSIIELAGALRRTIVAEGVETAEAMAVLRALGCPVAQGYYLSRPLPAPDVERWLRDSIAGRRLAGA